VSRNDEGGQSARLDRISHSEGLLLAMAPFPSLIMFPTSFESRHTIVATAFGTISPMMARKSIPMRVNAVAQYVSCVRREGREHEGGMEPRGKIQC